MNSNIPPAIAPADQRITVVLRAPAQGHLDPVRANLHFGDVATFGPSCAIVTGIAEGDALDEARRLNELEDLLGCVDETLALNLPLLAQLLRAYALVHGPDSPFCSAIAHLEHAADLLPSSSGESCSEAAAQLRSAMALPKPKLLGLASFAVDRPGADAKERGDELLLAVERVARQVIQRELTTGGLIARAVKEARHAS